MAGDAREPVGPGGLAVFHRSGRAARGAPVTLNGKVALVTGCSAPKGIGRACAAALAAEGAFVIVSDRPGEGRMEAVEALAGEIGGAALALDVTDAEQIAQAVAAAGAHGGVDILVNNAGTVQGAGPFLSGTAQDWEVSFRVNLLGPMLLAQAVIPGMIEKSAGRIINMGSIGGLGGRASFGAYSAMKHGVTGLTKTIAAEFGPMGIRCNAVCPGYIATDMHEASNIRLAEAEGVPLDAMKRRRYEAVALRAAGRPEDIAAAVLYLAGPQGDYVSGINLPVAGGIQLGL
ncbi:SDR family oxidoreductase [Roseovarius faecimaris]|uniref:SDR family oxidoreductase n=1 Tax=Roseovarius faecimaris TaxID=2494550 RepID=A0A6I6IRX5_9RHOB|nr:SDR family oxidoreductase [Roseovarius faecimaris]QGX98036.1 SDR family oxidoreductase [Roseovarius faecimaris]